jgi:NADH-quinone oxidoreductase subunit C
VPDATGLELIAQELSDATPGSVLGTTFERGRSEIQVDGSRIREILIQLQHRGFNFLASVHGVDYYPEEPRLGVIYELLDMHEVDRLAIKARLTIDEPSIPSVTGLYPGADFLERECFDMFGVIFDGHPDLRRILMPEDYEGFPQRRDFPIGGEPVLFTHNEVQSYGKNQ